MHNETRRSFLKATLASPALFYVGKTPKPSDVRIEDVKFSYETFHYRTPIKFGGTVLDRATDVNVRCRVRTVAGRTACKETGHPIDLNVALEPDYFKAAAELSRELKLAEPIRSSARW